METNYKGLVLEEHHDDVIYKGTEPWEFKVVEEDGKERKDLREKKKQRIIQQKNLLNIELAAGLHENDNVEKKGDQL